jgi:hypothetical protein
MTDATDIVIEAKFTQPRSRKEGAAPPKESGADDAVEQHQSARAEVGPKIDYDEAVAEGKQILAGIESSRGRLMRLGELADQVKKDYGGHRLKAFAKDIGIAACTLARCRSVYRAWEGKEAPAPVSYSVMQELQDHDHRLELVRNNPNMTKREARRIMRRQQKERAQANFASHLLEEQKRWFRSVVRHAGEALRDASITDGEISPTIRRALREVIEPKVLPTLTEAGEALIRLAAYLEQLGNEEEPPEQLPAGAAE